MFNLDLYDQILPKLITLLIIWKIFLSVEDYYIKINVEIFPTEHVILNGPRTDEGKLIWCEISYFLQLHPVLEYNQFSQAFSAPKLTQVERTFNMHNNGFVNTRKLLK